MSRNLSDYLASAIAQPPTDSDVRRRLDQLMGLLEALCSGERIDETEILKSVVLLRAAECLGLNIESLLSELPREISGEEVEKTHLLYVAHSQRQSNGSSRKALRILSDLFLLEQMGASHLEHVFRNWDGHDTVQLYEDVKVATDQAHRLAHDLQTTSGRQLAAGRLHTMNDYCARLEEEMKPVLDARRGSAQTPERRS